MNVLQILPVAVALALDAFAVSVVAGTSGRAPGVRATFRLAFHFGLFQFMMPILGWFAGREVVGLLAAVDHWIAFAVLVCVGLRLIRGGEAGGLARDPSRGWTLILLSIATSIDALAVGFSLALLGVRIWIPSAVIGLVAAVLSVIGHRFGYRLGQKFGRRTEIAGGLILILIALNILYTHLTHP